MKYLFSILTTFLFSVGALSDSGVVTNYLRMYPSYLPSLCNQGDMRFDINTLTFQFCGNANNWTVFGSGVLQTVPFGGTGLTSVPQNSLLMGGNSSSLSYLNPGTSGYVLTSTGSSVAWSSPSGGNTATFASSAGFASTAAYASSAGGIVGILPVVNGGTGNSSFGSNTVLLGNGTSSISALPLGANTYVLTSNGSSVAWSSPTGGLSSWATSTSYSVGQVVTYEKNAYVCLTANTAGSTFEADVALGYWSQLDTPTIQQNRMLVGNNFEDNDVGGWQIFTTTLTGVLPTGALTLGTAASMSIAATATNPLEGKYSLSLTNTASTNFTAGQGIISQVFNIPIADQAKMEAIQAAYQAYANVANGMSFSANSSGTWAWYIYDVTNTAWIQPAGVYNLPQGVGPAVSKGSTWQTPSNMTQFRLALVCINSTTATTPAAGAMTLLLDNFYVGPQITASGPAMSDWVAYTPTLTTNAGANAVTLNSTGKTDPWGMWRRVGDKIEVVGGFFNGSGGAATGTAGNINMSLPSGAVLDTAKLTTITTLGYQVGTTNVYVAATGFLTGPAQYASSLLNFQKNATGSNWSLSDIAASTSWSFSVSYPVSGWSSNTVMSSDTDTRLVAMQVAQATPTATVTSSMSLIKYTSGVVTDTHGVFSTSTGGYTCPVTGQYAVKANIGVLATYALNQYVAVGLGKNSTTVATYSTYQRMGGAETSAASTGLSVTIPCNAGDVLYPLVQSNGTTPTIASDATLNYFMVERLSGPAVVAASESVNGRYYNSASTITSSLATITYSTKSRDSHNAYASGTLTIPISGMYQFNAKVIINDASGVHATYIALYQNGVEVSANDLPSTPAATNADAEVNDVFPCNAGDLITVRASDTGTTPAISSNTTRNYFSWARVGN